MKPDDVSAADGASAGTPVLDLEHYRSMVAEQFTSEADADAFLHALWFIMCTFVEFGMDVKSSTASLPFMRDFSSAVGQGDVDSKSPPKLKPTRTPRKKR